MTADDSRGGGMAERGGAGAGRSKRPAGARSPKAGYGARDSGSTASAGGGSAQRRVPRSGRSLPGARAAEAQQSGGTPRAGGDAPRAGMRRGDGSGRPAERQAARMAGTRADGGTEGRDSRVVGDRGGVPSSSGGRPVQARGSERDGARARKGVGSAMPARASSDRRRAAGLGGVRQREGTTGAVRREDVGRSSVRGGAERAAAPPLPDSVVPADLDRAARSRLRTLSKENADAVARHLVMAGKLLEDDPEAAYAHAQEAVRRAGRVDVVREAAGITAYRTGRYAEALRELRTARRLNGSDEHVALMADCERGLGRPERALALAHEHAADLSGEERVEMAIVASGARLDLGDPEAALAELSATYLRDERPPRSWRIDEARAAALSAAGRTDEAAQVLAALPAEAFGPEEVEVVDLEEDDSGDVSLGGGGATGSDDAGEAPTTDGSGSGPIE